MCSSSSVNHWSTLMSHHVAVSQLRLAALFHRNRTEVYRRELLQRANVDDDDVLTWCVYSVVSVPRVDFSARAYSPMIWWWAECIYLDLAIDGPAHWSASMLSHSWCVSTRNWTSNRLISSPVSRSVVTVADIVLCSFPSPIEVKRIDRVSSSSINEHDRWVDFHSEYPWWIRC